MAAEIPDEIREMFRKWGKQGGKARNANLTADQRRKIATKASKAAVQARKMKTASKVVSATKKA